MKWFAFEGRDKVINEVNLELCDNIQFHPNGTAMIFCHEDTYNINIEDTKRLRAIINATKEKDSR